MKEAKEVGRATDRYLFVMVSRPSEGMEAWFWRALPGCGVQKTDVRIVYLIDEPPAGAGNKPLKSQLRSARDRFVAEVKKSRPDVVIPMGTEPFYTLTGINEGIFDARGYVIRKQLFHPIPTEVWKEVGKYVNASKATGAKKGDPKMKWVKVALPPLLDGFDGVVIPVFSPDHIRTEGFAVKPAFKEDVLRARRAVEGDLREMDQDFTYVSTLEELPNMAAWGPIVAIDIETHGIDNEVIDLVSISDGRITACLEWTEGARLYVEKLFKTKRLFAVHNSPFDLPRLVANGVRISQETLDSRVFDTMFGAVVLQPDLHKALGRVASFYLDTGPWKTSSRKEDSHWRAMVKADPNMYAAKDSFHTAWIAVQESAVMKSMGVWDMFMGQGKYPGPGIMATIPVLAAMSRGGLKTNKPYAVTLCERLEKRIFRYLKLWTRMFPNVKASSNPQVQRLFYKQWGLPVQRSKEDGVSVDELALVKLGAFVDLNKDTELHPGPWRKDKRATGRTFELLLKIRATSKMLSTYAEPVMLGETTWVHPSYLPASKDDERGGNANKSGEMRSKGNTATGRLSSYHPNIQNQPKKMRVPYVPDNEEMCFVQADYKSAELYVLAGMSGDKQLAADLRADMHQKNADRLGISRKVAKNVTYASQYLASPAKQSEMILEQEHIYVSPAECLTVSEGIWGYYTDATAYKQLLVDLCEKKKYITNPFGRTRFFHDGRSPAAVDFIPQSCVADMLWCVLKPVAEMARRYGSPRASTVRGSILICVPSIHSHAAALEMKSIMEQRFDCVRKGFFVPVELGAGGPGESWGTLRPLAL